MSPERTQTTGLGKVVWSLIALGVLTLCGLSGGLVYLATRVVSSVSDATAEQRRLAEAAAASAARARDAAEKKALLEHQVREHEAKMAALTQQLAAAKDEATRRALQKQIDDEMGKAPARKNGPGNPRNRPACNCTPGDPLCSCL